MKKLLLLVGLTILVCQINALKLDSIDFGLATHGVGLTLTY